MATIYDDIVKGEKTTVMPTATIYDDIVKKTPIKVSEPSKPSLVSRISDFMINEPTGKRAETTLGQLPSSISENLPFVGGIVKTLKQEPELAEYVTPTNLIKSIPSGILELGKSFGRGFVSGAINLVDLFKDKEGTKIEIPGLGEITSAKVRATERVNNGENPVVVVLEEGATAIFDTLFFLSIASKPFTPRYTPITPKVKAPEGGITVQQPPKSFRLYEPPKTTIPLTPEFMTRAEQQGISFTKYNPKLPTFFKVSGTAGGDVTGQIIQIKPSYFNLLKNKLFTPADPAYTYTQTAINNSQAADVSKMIEQGDVPKTAVYKQGEILQPDFAQGRINDIAQKLDNFKTGLGQQFKAKVDINNSTMDGLVKLGQDILNSSISTTPPLPTGEITTAQIMSIPQDKVIVVYEQKANTNDIVKAAETPVPTKTIYDDLVKKPETEVGDISHLAQEARKFNVFDKNKKLLGEVEAKDFYYAEDKAKELFGEKYGYLMKKPQIATPEQSLIQEARQYKSAEEFVNSRKYLYHGTDDISAAKIEKEGFKGGAWEDQFGNKKTEPISLIDSEKGAKQAAEITAGKSGGKPVIVKVDVTDLPLKDKKRWASMGEYGNEFIAQPSELKTKSQLTDIWKEANKYRYHETSLENLEKIKDIGLKPSKGMSGKGVYFSPEIGKGEASGRGVILRTTKENLDTLKYNEFRNIENGKIDEGWTESSVPSEFLEYSKDGGKTWQKFNQSQLTDIWKEANKVSDFESRFTKGELPSETKLTLATSKVKTPEEIKLEAEKVGLLEKVQKTTEKGQVDNFGRPTGMKYVKSDVVKSDVKTILASSNEFNRNPVLKVEEIEGGKILTFKGKDHQFSIKPQALGLNPEVLEVGSEIRVDKKSLVGKDVPQQMRVYKGDEAYASLASPQGNKTIRKILDKLNKTETTEVQEVPKDFKISDRAKQILEEFGVKYGEREVPNRFLGIYKPKAKKVRVQAFYDITTVTHEATHAIDDKIGFTKKLIADTKHGAKVRKQLTDIYEALYPKGKRTHSLDKRMKEGLATLIENYFYDPIGTTATYPELVNEFIKPSGRFYSAEFSRLLEKMNELVDDYAKLPPEDRIASRIRTGKEIVDKHSGFTFGQRIVFEVFNRFEPLKRYAKETGVSETWDDPFVQAFNIMNKNAIVFQWVKGKQMPILMKDGNFKFENGSVADYLKLVKGKEKDFRSYLVARRVFEANNELNALKNATETDITEAGTIDERIKKLESIIANDDFSVQDTTAVVEKFSDTFAEAEKIYDSINKNLITQAEETGLLNSEVAETFRNEKGYASFRRFIDDEISSGVGTIKTSSKSKVSSFKERTGSQLDIVDPVYNQILAINEMVGKGMENLLWLKVAKLANSNSDIAARFEKIEPKATIDAEGRISFPQERDPEIIRLFRDGKREFYKVAPEFLGVMKTLRGKEFDAFVQLLRIPSSIFTRLTTSANPFFAAGNLSVDQFSALTQTKTGFKPVVDPAKSLFSWLTGEEMFKQYIATGGKRQTLAAYFDLSPDEIVTKLTGGTTKLEKVSGVIDNALGILEFPSNMSELMTRFSEYQRAISEGEPMSVAMFRASEVTTPFQLSGNWGGRLGQEYIRSIPYLNALIEVLYKFGRTTKENPKRVVSVGAGLLVAGLTTAILTMKYASEKQKRLLAEQPVRNLSRYLYFPSPNGEGLLRFRIPEQFGIFTGLAYMFVIQHYGGNKITFDNYIDNVSSAVPEQINFLEPKKAILSFVPQVLKPSVLVAANTKTYPEVGPIVSPFMIDKAPNEQYTAYTPKVAKVIGNLLNASPILVDYWVRNQFGVVSGLLLGKMPTNPIYVQEKEFVMSGRSYNNFYDKRTIVNQQYDEIIKNNPKNYSVQDKIEITNTRKIYNLVSDILSEMREISKEHELPEDIKTGMYQLLLKIDDQENKNLGAEIGSLKSKIYVFKSKNKIR